MTDFAAIDFETANECPSSVCSVGVVVVREGEIVDSFYSLIHPEPITNGSAGRFTASGRTTLTTRRCSLSSGKRSNP